MATVIDTALRNQLIDRRKRLESAATVSTGRNEVLRLLHDVDTALERMDQGTYGLCEACHDSIEPERLLADPMTQFCIDHLTSTQQRALEEDLGLAARIQHGLLPKPDFTSDGWEVAFHYEPAGLVSGDYCDVFRGEDGSLFFILGDVSGKGVAASMLMAHLHAMFRALIFAGLPLNQLVERASRMFCESTLPSHFATLVCGRADRAGAVEICNAGHLPPLWLRGREVGRIEATGFPIGIFCDAQFTATPAQMAPGDTLLLYTDGLTEARDPSGAEYGYERLSRWLREQRDTRPRALTDACIRDLKTFRNGAPKTDDLAVMTIGRTR